MSIECQQCSLRLATHWHFAMSFDWLHLRSHRPMQREPIWIMRVEQIRCQIGRQAAERRRVMKSLAIIPLGLGIMLAAIPARADETSCTGSLVGKTINGNLVVPDGATCSLTNVRVTGNVLVRTGATLVMPGGNVTISGNLYANQCKNVFIRTIGGPVSVGGNVVIRALRRSPRVLATTPTREQASRLREISFANPIRGPWGPSAARSAATPMSARTPAAPPLSLATRSAATCCASATPVSAGATATRLGERSLANAPVPSQASANS
jgi:hypothetical protein